MAKKKTHRHVSRHHHTTAPRGARNDNYLVVVRGWMLVVAFALMLGIGATVGNFINQQLDASSPAVAGAAIER